MGASGAVNDLGYNPDKLYFLNNLLNYISVGPLQGVYREIQNPSQGFPSILAYILIIIVILGLGIYLYRIFKKKIGNMDSDGKKTITHSLILVVLLCLGTLSFFYSSYLITELIFLTALFTGYRLFKGTGEKLEMDFLFLSWFAAFFIFHSIIPLRWTVTSSP